MNKFKIFFLSTLTIILISISTKSLTLDLPIVPVDIKQYLDTKNCADLLSKWHARSDARMGMNTKTIKLKNGSRYYIKYGIERFFNAQKVKAVIAKYNLNLLSVPDKYLYHVNGRPEDFSSENYLVVVKATEGKTGKGLCIDINHVKQLYCLAIKANHYDLHCANYILTTDNKIVIIDTDKLAMPSQEKCATLRMDYLLNGKAKVIQGFVQKSDVNDPINKLELMLYSKWPNFQDRAYKFLKLKINKREEIRKQRLEEYKKTNNENLSIIDDSDSLGLDI